MGKVVLDYSISLDGFITGPDDNVDQPPGTDGHLLMQWVFGERGDVENAMVEASEAGCGAVVVGRRSYDICSGPNGWGEGPFGRTPVFVVSHGVAEHVATDGAPFTFINDRVESANAQAKEIADGKDIEVMGAKIAQQLLNLDLVDEIRLHLAPIVLGGGVRLFTSVDPARFQQRAERAIASNGFAHITFSRAATSE